MRPILEYAPFAWMSAGPSHNKHLVQRRALGFIGHGTFLHSISLRLEVATLCYLYKLQYLTGPQQLRDMLPSCNTPSQPTNTTPTTHQAHTRHTFQLDNTLPRSALDYLQQAFPFCILLTWNSLPCAILPDRPHPKGLQKFKTMLSRNLQTSKWLWSTDFSD